MFKKLVAVLIAAISVFSLSGCGSQTDIDAINEKLESMESRMEDLETSLDRMTERNAEEKEDVREVASNAEETPSNASNPDVAAPDGSNETDSRDVETDLDKVYDAVQAWVDESQDSWMKHVYYYKCALINDDDIPEVLLFDQDSGLLAILSVDEKYEVCAIDTIKVTDVYEVESYGGNGERSLTSAISGSYHATNKLDDSETFCYNPKADSFAMDCSGIAQNNNNQNYQFTSHIYMELSLSDKMIKEIGQAKEFYGIYYAGDKNNISSSAYDEYNAQFTYTDSFVVKEESYFLLKSAFDAFKSEIGAQ